MILIVKLYLKKKKKLHTFIYRVHMEYKLKNLAAAKCNRSERNYCLNKEVDDTMTKVEWLVIALTEYWKNTAESEAVNWTDSDISTRSI